MTDTQQPRESSDVAGGPLPAPGVGVRPRNVSLLDRASMRRTAGAIAIEVLVLVLGLYGALLLDSYRERRHDQAQRRQILLSMRQYLAAVATETQEAAVETETQLLRPFDEAYGRGDMPRPLPILTGASGMSTGVWEAMLAAGGIDVLDPRLIHDVELYYSIIRHGITVTERFAQMTRQQIVPMLDADITEFYDPQTRRLRRRYEWYPVMLKEYARQIRRMGAETDKVVQRLDEQLQRMP